MVLSVLTEGERFDSAMLAGGDHGFENWRKLHGRWNVYTVRRARSLFREILPPTQVKIDRVDECDQEDGRFRETPL